MSNYRRAVYHNADAQHWTPDAAVAPPTQCISSFHSLLPGYKHSPLVSLDAEAQNLSLGRVLLKDEGERCGLPAFKFLGASWAIHQILTRKTGLPPDASLAQLKQALSSPSNVITLFAATDGNHGRAVARMGAILALSVTIYVPAGLSESTIRLIKSEGAVVVQSQADYDGAVLEAHNAAKAQGDDGILVQDTAFDQYTIIPKWIVEGYTTMLYEVDQQLPLDDSHIDLAIVPAGVGSLAQAVVSYLKHHRPGTRVLVVEPDTAACVHKSLRAGGAPQQDSTTTTTPACTIMTGLDCGTVSSIAWPVLRAGVDASATVSDHEAHTALQHLREQYAIGAGPCGGAALAALRRLSPQDRAALGLKATSTVLLLSTEGAREYKVPRDVSVDDVESLTQTLVQFDPIEPGGVETARYIASWFQHRDVETQWIESTPGRPSVVAVACAAGGESDQQGGNKRVGNLMMPDGHIDNNIVSHAAAHAGDPLGGLVGDGSLCVRVAPDMEAGVAAAMVATARAARTLSLARDVCFGGCC